MQTALRLETTILPGHRLEISDPKLPEGARVEVIVILPEQPKPGRMSVLEFLESLPPGPRVPYLGRVRTAPAGGKRLVGTLTLPASGLVYVDSNPVIYTVEKHPVYGPLLR